MVPFEDWKYFDHKIASAITVRPVASLHHGGKESKNLRSKWYQSA